MKTRTRKCIVCGTEYRYCGNCAEYATAPEWMSIYHDENCKNIMSIATEYMAGNMTKAEAKEALDACDMTNKKKFKASVAKAVNEIYSVKASEKSVSTKAEVGVKVDKNADKI